jgi:surface antigen
VPAPVHAVLARVAVAVLVSATVLIPMAMASDASAASTPRMSAQAMRSKAAKGCRRVHGHRRCPSIRTAGRHGQHLARPHGGRGGANPYAGGGCTAWAWANRPDLPGRLGDAKYWAANARKAGFPVDNRPEVGAIAVYQPGVYGAYAPWGHVAVVTAVQGSRVQISEANFRYDTIVYRGRWTGIAGVQFIYRKGSPASTPAPAPAPAPVTPAPPPAAPTAGAPVDRAAVTSYDRLAAGAPHNGYFLAAWQDFTAASNRLTTVGINIGSPGAAPGGVGTTVTVRLCAVAPDPANGNCSATVGEAHPQINNYGATVTDIGDVAVTRGQRYWLIWYQPPALNGQTWSTYWWDGGASVTTSAGESALVRGYNR